MSLNLSKRLFSRRNVVIVSGKRTPIGTFMGGLSHLTAPQLGIAATKGALESSGVKAEDIEEIIYGNVISAGTG